VGSNTIFACGNAGNATYARITFAVLILRQNSATLTVAISGVNVTRITLTQAAVNQGNVSLVGLAGTAVSPTSITSGFWDQVQNNYIPITLDVPCTSFGDYSNTDLALTHEPCTQVFQVDTFAVNACRMETCEGQNITCPGLKSTRACTPGYDCTYYNSIWKTEAGTSNISYGLLRLNVWAQKCYMSINAPFVHVTGDFMSCCDTFCIGKGMDNSKSDKAEYVSFLVQRQ
jgi:hypothetical protein